MAHYLIAQANVSDDGGKPEYAAPAHGIIRRHGGKHLSRSGNITMLEGADFGANLVAIIEVPTGGSLPAFVPDPDYAPCARARQAGADSHFAAIDNSGAAGTISCLTAGG